MKEAGLGRVFEYSHCIPGWHGGNAEPYAAGCWSNQDMGWSVYPVVAGVRMVPAEASLLGTLHEAHDLDVLAGKVFALARSPAPVR